MKVPESSIAATEEIDNNLEQLVQAFLGTFKSPDTRTRYRAALNLWLHWCKEHRLDPLQAEPEHADLWSAELRASRAAPATTNSSISGVSSWYTKLVKWRRIRTTPFLRVARAIEGPTGKKNVPSCAEMKAIIDAARGVMPLYQAVVTMAYRGLTVSSLPDLVVDGDNFTTLGKGGSKPWHGKLPKEVVAVLKQMGRRPFAGMKIGTLQAAFKRLTTKLADTGEIKHEYSVNDLRYFFAYQEIDKDRSYRSIPNLARLMKLSLKGTLRYLDELPIDDRQAPDWISDLDAKTGSLFKEVIAAVNHSLFVVASTGVRTLLDVLMTDTVGDMGSFSEKLAAMKNEGYIDDLEHQTLLPVIEAGHASAHRGFVPSRPVLNDMIDITEHLLEKIEIAPKKKAELANKAAAIKEVVPPRKPRV
jgi:hypothetical protein